MNYFIGQLAHVHFSFGPVHLINVVKEVITHERGYFAGAANRATAHGSATLGTAVRDLVTLDQLSNEKEPDE
jgi:hypothetical protein